MQARVVALDEEYVQLVRPSVRLANQAQVAGRDVDLEVGAGVRENHFGGQGQLIRVHGPPDRLMEALLERGRFPGVQVAGAVAQGKAALPGAELDRNGVILAVSRSLR